MNLIKLYRDPGVSEAGAATAEPSSVGEAMLSAMDKSAESVESKEVSHETESKETKSKFAWGDEDRRKSRYEPKDDDEFDLGWEDEKDGVKTNRKFKLSEIKEEAKWLRENRSLINSALGMREQFTKNPELSKAFSLFWNKAHEGDKYNPEAVAKMHQMLEGKAEVIAEKVDDNADDIAEAEKELAELDPESPQYKIAKRSLNALKAVRSQLKTAEDSNKTLQGKLDGLDKFKTGFEETQKTQKSDAEAKQAGELFDTTLGALTSSEYKFDDADESKEFESSVRDMVATQAQKGKINNDQEFTKAIQDAAKATFERISKRNERVVNEYLKKKGKLPPEKEVKKEKEPEKEQSIGEALAGGMFPDKKQVIPWQTQH